jgi:hypothetical protein
VSEENPFANPVQTTGRDTAIDGTGIALWALVAAAVVAVVLVLRRNRRRSKADVVAFHQHNPNRVGKKKHLLDDKYYKNDFSHLK